MKSLVTGGTLVLVLLAVTLSPMAFGDEKYARRPIVMNGDSWTYKTLTDTNATGREDAIERFEVTFANDSAIIGTSTRAFGGKTEETDWTSTSHWNSVTSTRSGIARDTNKVIFSPNRGTFRFPLKVGDEYKVTFDVIAATANASRVVFKHDRTIKIVGWLEITVPAGKFEAILVESDGTQLNVENGRSISHREKYWYSPAVRRWVKYVLENMNARLEGELIAYELKKE